MSVQTHHLKLLDRAVVSLRSIHQNAWQQQVSLDIMLVTCFITFSRGEISPQARNTTSSVPLFVEELT